MLGSTADPAQLLRAGRLADAQAAAQRILAQSPGQPDALWVLTSAARAQARWDEAEELAERGRQLAPGDPRFPLELGKIAAGLGDDEAALARFEAVLATAPDLGGAHGERADALRRLGRVDEAWAALRPRFESGTSTAFEAIVAMRLHEAAGELDEAIAVGGAHLESAVDPYLRRNINMRLGRLHERAGRVDEAIAAYAAGQRGVERPWRADQARRRTTQIMSAYSAEQFPKLARSTRTSARPILIVGMPRSGSTLIEQALDCHPDIVGVGEATFGGQLLPELRRRLGTHRHYPACVDELTPAHADALADHYLANLTAAAGPTAARVVDKSLGNHRRLGLFRLLLPNAAVIHTRRNALDNCWSCYTTNLSPIQHPWITSLDRIGRTYVEYARVMAHWRTIDVPMLEVDYEALVQDPETHFRAIIAHCGLDWDPACLTPSASNRAALTASREQVRKPIYTSSIDRAKPFSEYLVPLRETLEAAQ